MDQTIAVGDSHRTKPHLGRGRRTGACGKYCGEGLLELVRQVQSTKERIGSSRPRHIAAALGTWETLVAKILRLPVLGEDDRSLISGFLLSIDATEVLLQYPRRFRRFAAWLLHETRITNSDLRLALATYHLHHQRLRTFFRSKGVEEWPEGLDDNGYPVVG